MRQWVAMFTLALHFAGCDASDKTSAPIIHHESVPDLAPYSAPPEIRLSQAPTHRAVLTPAKRLQDCHTIFEPDGQIAKTLPWAESALFESLIGCQAEAWLTSPRGIFIAYGVPAAEGRKNLRIVSYNKALKYRWSVLADRTDQGTNFVANYRRGFLTEVGQRHVCAGTLWEGGTQATCVNQATGEVEWNGRMAFWAGLGPTGGENAFFVADLASLTKRYPFSGVEMRHRKLDGTGGRAALYATDGAGLFFAPARAEEPRLVYYDFATMTPIWRTALPDNPATAFGEAFAELGIVTLKIGETLLIVDSKNGKPLWSLAIGSDRPSIAATKDTLIVLHRVPDVPNPVVGFAPKTGAIQWQATAPSGVLNVASDGETVVLSSVRSTHVLSSIEPL